MTITADASPLSRRRHPVEGPYYAELRRLMGPVPPQYFVSVTAALADLAQGMADKTVDFPRAKLDLSAFRPPERLLRFLMWLDCSNLPKRYKDLLFSYMRRDVTVIHFTVKDGRRVLIVQ